MDFDEMNTEQPVKFSESLVVNNPTVVKDKQLNNDKRITQLVSRYNRCTLGLENGDVRKLDLFYRSHKSKDYNQLTDNSVKVRSY
jgi:hypothetical protein